MFHYVAELCCGIILVDNKKLDEKNYNRMPLILRPSLGSNVCLY